MTKLTLSDDILAGASFFELQVSYRNTNAHLLAKKFKICSSHDAYKFLQTIYDPDTLQLKEYFYLLCTNRANEVIAWYQVSNGGISGTVVDVRIIYITALGCACSGIILAHNHPSGNLTPSAADINLTNQIASAGKILDIPVLDHIIIGHSGYYSFADEGTLRP